MKRLQLIIVLMGIGSALMAQPFPYSYIEVNNVRGCILGNGCLMDNHQTTPYSSWEVPKDSGKSPLFQHALWIGGISTADNSLHLAGDHYGQNGQEFWSGPLRLSDASTDATTVEKYSHVWNLTKEQIEDFIAHHAEPGYTIPEDILTWPAHGDAGFAENLAPFVDVDANGVYQPEHGDYPKIEGDQCLFFIFNDSYQTHTEFAGEPLGLEVHAMVYAYDRPDNEYLNNTVFFNYKLFNRSANTYTGTYVGLWNDWDIGYGYDDYVGCDVHRGASYGYNADPEDDTYGTNHPAQVCKILAGPYMDPDGLDNPSYNGNCESLDNNRNAFNGTNFGNGVIDDERMGMTRFIGQYNSSGDVGDPSTAEEVYNYLRSIWRSGVHLMYGGDGFAGPWVVGPNCSFQYPGDSDPCNIGTFGEAPNANPMGWYYNTPEHYWTETHEGNAPGDRRGLASMGPFTFDSGSMQEIDFAEVTVWGDGRASAMERIGEYIDYVAEYAGFPTTSVNELQDTPRESLMLYPNPTQDHFTVEGTGHLVIMNVLGQQVMSMNINGVETVKLPQGMYFLRLEQENGVRTGRIVVE